MLNLSFPLDLGGGEIVETCMHACGEEFSLDSFFFPERFKAPERLQSFLEGLWQKGREEEQP